MNIILLREQRTARLNVIAELLGRTYEFPNDLQEAEDDNFQTDVQLIERN